MPKLNKAPEVEREEFADEFEFLDELRKSGKTNMFGAIPFIIDEWPSMGRDEAERILKGWMSTFSRGETPDERAAKFRRREQGIKA